MLASAGAAVLTVSDLVAALRAGELPDRAVALTFDDAFASVVSEAAPRLLRREWPATVFCVAAHLDGTNDWATQPPTAPRRPLASSADVARMARAGLEIGGHTMSHAPLGDLTGRALHDEVVGSRARLEEIAGTAVRGFACPYGDPPAGEARALVKATYDYSCGTRLNLTSPDADTYALPRVDAHYVRNPNVLERVVRGQGSAYLATRRAGARLRRLVVHDFVPVADAHP